MEHANPLDPDACIEIRERLVERGRIRDVDTRRPPVARVEAEAEPRMPVDGVRERRELGDRAADRAARSGSVLHAQPEIVGRELEELAQRGLDDLDGLVEPEPEVGADVEDDRLRADRVRRLHRRPQRRQRVLAHGRVAAREVHEVEGVTGHRLHARLAAPFPEPRDLLRCVLGRPPHPRALREDLDGVPADLLHAVDRLRDPACCRDVSAEEHSTRREAGPRAGRSREGS